jgi:hypothetical protein
MSIPFYETTSDAPPIPVSFVDSYGNIPASFTSGAFTLKFRSLSTGQKVSGGGTFSGASQTTGIVNYNLSSSDMANAYAVSALGSAVGGALPGTELFEVLAEATISSLVYDSIPSQIAIRKI